MNFQENCSVKIIYIVLAHRAGLPSGPISIVSHITDISFNTTYSISLLLSTCDHRNSFFFALWWIVKHNTGNSYLYLWVQKWKLNPNCELSTLQRGVHNNETLFSWPWSGCCHVIYHQKIKSRADKTSNRGIPNFLKLKSMFPN